MPKQRNHQHHHAKSSRANGFQLPLVEQYGDTPGLPRIVYPQGWKPKWLSANALMLLGLTALIILVMAVGMLLAQIFS